MTSVPHVIPAVFGPDQAAFKHAMGAVATPVSIVTALGDRPHGTTVSAFASLSLDPPMILVSLQTSSTLLPVIRETGRFGLNVLAHDQAATAARFARRGIDRFGQVGWSTSGGVPKLAGVACWTACSVAGLIPAGDHVIVTGLVEAVEFTRVPGLVYQHQTFGAFEAIPDGPASVDLFPGLVYQHRSFGAFVTD